MDYFGANDLFVNLSFANITRIIHRFIIIWGFSMPHTISSRRRIAVIEIFLSTVRRKTPINIYFIFVYH